MNEAAALQSVSHDAQADAAEVKAFAQAAIGKVREALKAANIDKAQLKAAVLPLVADCVAYLAGDAPALMRPVVSLLLTDMLDKLLDHELAKLAPAAPPAAEATTETTHA